MSQWSVQPLCALTGQSYVQITFSCLLEQSSDTKEGFLGPKGTWSLAFWGDLYYNPFCTAVSTASWQKREARNSQSRHFYRAKRLFPSLSWSEFALCYQRGLKPPKWALAAIPNCNNAVAQTAGTFPSAVWVWLSHPRTAYVYCNLTRKHFTQILWLDLVCSNQV